MNLLVVTLIELLLVFEVGQNDDIVHSLINSTRYDEYIYANVILARLNLDLLNNTSYIYSSM